MQNNMQNTNPDANPDANPDDVRTDAQNDVSAEFQRDLQRDIPPKTESERTFLQRQNARVADYARADPRRALYIVIAVVLILLNIIIKFTMELPQPHVSLAGEPLMLHGPSWFTNSFLTTIVVDIILLALAFGATRNLRLVPSGLQNVFEALMEFIQNLAEGVAGKNADKYFAWVTTLFLFIIISNYSGLIPLVGSLGFYHPAEAEHATTLDGQLAMANGELLLVSAEARETQAAEAEHEKLVPLFRAPSADLSTTFALALATMFMVQYHGFSSLGGKYFKKFAFWSPSGQGFMKGINGFVSFLELISEISRILTFSFRLFGNIFAGEVVLAVISFLVPFLIPVVFYGLEVMVGAIQAFVFMMLALVFFNMATISHDHPEGQEAH